MMEFIADLERKVDRMKADSETAAEELIQLRGHHQSLKKSHQLLSQQLEQYVEMSRQQEYLMNTTQQEIKELDQKRHPDVETPQNGIHEAIGTSMNGIGPVAFLPFQSTPIPQTIPAEMTLPASCLPTEEMCPPTNSSTAEISMGAPSLSAAPIQPSPLPPLPFDSPKDSLMKGTPLRDVFTDLYDLSDPHMLSLMDIFGEESDLAATSHRSRGH